MKLTETLTAFLGNVKLKEAKAIRTRIALALNFTETWIGLCIKQNKENGPLTTAAALEVIRKETGLNDEEILEREEARRRKKREGEKGEIAQ